jgi:hypothetical protein
MPQIVSNTLFKVWFIWAKDDGAFILLLKAIDYGYVKGWHEY